MSEWADMIVAVTGLLTAIALGTYRLYRDRNTAREAEMTAAKNEAAAQARLEARTEQAEATVKELKEEIASKDADRAALRRQLADCDTARAELRHLLLSCRGESSP